MLIEGTVGSAWGDYLTADEFKNKTYRALLRLDVKSIGLKIFMNANIAGPGIVR
jgi:hypothetical protein